jgi:hypothetical protein
MWVFTELADWWESQRRQSVQGLDNWVESSNYNQGVMIVAASTQALMTFGAGFVDVLRVGDGVKMGTASGVGQDALRVLAVFPVGKAANLLKNARGALLARVVVDTGGPNCFWVASAKAFAQIGQKFNGTLLASVEDVAKALGMSMDKLWTIPNLATGIAYLQRLGAKVGAVKNVTSATQIAQMVPRDGSVVMIAVHVVEGGKVIGGHAIYAFRNALGQIRYMDRTISSAKQAGYTSLDEIAKLYTRGGQLTPVQAAVLENVVIKSVAHEAPRLLIPILGVIATNDKK